MNDLPRDQERDAASAELRDWLQRDPPQIPPKYFYDLHGSELFEQITHTAEYYPTRTELGLLEQHAAAIVADARPREIAEIGAGASRKTRLLLDALVATEEAPSLLLFDIAGEFLAEAAATLRGEYPGLSVREVVGDFHSDLGALGAGGRRLLVFLAGTIGNLDRAEAAAFLSAVHDLLAEGDAFLLGVDLVKDPEVLEAAYDDAAGVTAAFNRNMLSVVNSTFDADFDPESFAHRATWNAERERIEMWLDATRDMVVTVPAAGLRLQLVAGDGIRTELSCKYTRRGLLTRLEAAGLRLDRWFTDADGLFALALIRRSDP